jgi:hypothetical protein
MDGGGIKDVMENLRMGTPSRNGDRHDTATSFQENSAEYAEFISWRTRRAAAAAAAEAEKQEREREEERERVAGAVYRHQVHRAKRAFSRAARAALVGGAVMAALAWAATLLKDTYREE